MLPSSKIQAVKSGKSYPKRKYRTQNQYRDEDTLLPFPIVSVTTFLFIIVLAAALSALYIGARRNPHGVNVIDLSLASRLHPVPMEVGNGGSTVGHGNSSGNTNGNTNGDTNGDNQKDGPTIRSFQDLTPAELHPQAGPHRHIVTPPADTKPITLVTCTTTVGYLHIVVHPSWAPHGAGRFLTMVESKYFSTKVALMRCMKNFLCQFGIAGDPSYNKPYNGKAHLLEDDPNWLPEGPTHRKNELGVKRFGKGYMAYAGSGQNSRSNQFIVALADHERLGGGSPWEVPWGEVVGKESFDTLDKIYTGYGEKGPSQPRLSKEGSSEGVAKDFPKLDYVLGCDVIDSR